MLIDQDVAYVIHQSHDVRPSAQTQHENVTGRSGCELEERLGIAPVGKDVTGYAATTGQRDSSGRGAHRTIYSASPA